jgi:hypothetical protein
MCTISSAVPLCSSSTTNVASNSLLTTASSSFFGAVGGRSGRRGDVRRLNGVLPFGGAEGPGHCSRNGPCQVVEALQEPCLVLPHSLDSIGCGGQRHYPGHFPSHPSRDTIGFHDPGDGPDSMSPRARRYRMWACQFIQQSTRKPNHLTGFAWTDV